jgi:RecJ-like exonuclease
MGFLVDCKKCKGTGNMGQITSVRCNLCHGTGEMSIGSEDSLAEDMLWEFFEGFLDPDTDDAWLEAQLKGLIKQRKKDRSG